MYVFMYVYITLYYYIYTICYCIYWHIGIKHILSVIPSLSSFIYFRYSIVSILHPTLYFAVYYMHILLWPYHLLLKTCCKLYSLSILHHASWWLERTVIPSTTILSCIREVRAACSAAWPQTGESQCFNIEKRMWLIIPDFLVKDLLWSK